ncbi:MAG: DUF3857 domain-containing protein [Candidatus Latescibacteria bacterium]|nr:DUF3857 domain-containing protein [Candidatus Latescibacterota bacterium]NIO57284.1 DUF3857 domain-containing protein [Candidatus Latescibacterota bacterium]
MEYQQANLPFLSRLGRKLANRWRTRDGYEFEWECRYAAETQEIVLTFFVERSPALFELAFLTTELIHIDRLAYGRGDKLEFMQFEIQRQREGDILRVLVTPASRIPTTRVLLRLKNPPPDFDYRVNVKVVGSNQEDLRIVLAAHNWASVGEVDMAIEQLHRYEEYNTENPTISYWFSEWYRQRGEIDKAERYALEAVSRGNIELCSEKYRSVQRVRKPHSIEEIRALQEQARQWPLGGHHGLLVIERRQQFVLGLDNCHLRKCHHLIEIRRPAAARMLRHLAFAFSTATEFILFTGMRIIHADGEAEEVPRDHFTISDHESKNILITVEDEKAGHWILPDLAPGDVIDWTYHLLCKDRQIDGAPNVFILTSLFDSFFPTFRAQAEFVAPAGQRIRFSVRNSDIAENRTVVDGKDVVVFQSERFVPARRTGFLFENNYLNPVVICASDGIGWQDVAREALKSNFGTLPAQDELPEPLGPLIEGTDEQLSALESAFYWIRDKLKYASIRSGLGLIGQTDRARRIIEAGVGNCNDKSYLLALACRRLNLPHEFVAISTKNGVLVDNAPADQFDHVFLRVKVDERWIYLDAANPLSTFGSAPAWCQGMQALVLDNEGTIITIPVDSPEINALEISEVFDVCRDGCLCGRFRFRARGQSARLADERWKMMSLSLDDQQQAGQEALREFLPSSNVLGYSREMDTSISSEFHVSGQHSRGPLVPLGKNRNVIGTLSWEVPFLPVRYWRTLQIGRLFVVDFPMKVQIEVRLKGDPLRLVDDASSIQALDNPVCSIHEDVIQDASAMSVRRTIIFKKKFMHDDTVSLVPRCLEQIEEALQLVVSFDAAVM